MSVDWIPGLVLPVVSKDCNNLKLVSISLPSYVILPFLTASARLSSLVPSQASFHWVSSCKRLHWLCFNLFMMSEKWWAWVPYFPSLGLAKNYITWALNILAVMIPLTCRFNNDVQSRATLSQVMPHKAKMPVFSSFKSVISQQKLILA